MRLDSITMEDHLGNRLNLAEHDTLTWNFWKGEGWPNTSALDTFERRIGLLEGSGVDMSAVDLSAEFGGNLA